MIIDYDHNQNLNTDRKLDSLKESVQMALNENDAEHKGFRALFDKVNASVDSIKSQIADILNRLGQDFIVEQGTSGEWKYRKWHSGRIEAWAYHSFGSQTGASWGSTYYKDVTYNLPTNLFSSVKIYASSSNQSWGVFGASESSGTITIRMIRHASNGANMGINFYCEGV